MTAEAEAAQSASQDQAQANESPEDALVRRATIDPGVPFEKASLEFLSGLAADKYESMIARLKRAGVRISRLETMLGATAANDDDDAPDEKNAGPDRPTQAHQILTAIEPEVELFHTPDKQGFMRLRVNGIVQTVNIEGSNGFKLIRRRFFELTQQIAQQDSIKAAQSIMDQHAQDGPERRVYLRVANHGGGVYVDLGDDAQSVVRISRDGWEIVNVDEVPVIFVRRNGMRPLPLPLAGGKIEALNDFLNLTSENERRLFIAALTYAFNSRGPYLLVAVHGEQGTAKSTQAIIFRKLLDPSISMLRSMPKSEDDLFIQAVSCWLQSYDNVSTISHEASDALCRLLTGGGIGKRALYTDLDQVLVDIMRPCIVTSIPNVAERGDLADRAIMLAAVPIPLSKRRHENELWDEFAKVQAGILGALFDMVACGLRELPSVSSKNLYRMADFHLWGRAIETMNGGTGTFDAAYHANRNNSVVVAVKTDSVAAGIVKMLVGLREKPAGLKEWSGTATDLRSTLIAQAGSDARLGQQPGFPKNARALSQHLTRISPLLRDIDITWERDKSAEARGLIIRAPKDGKFASLATFATAEPACSGEDDDHAHDAHHDNEFPEQRPSAAEPAFGGSL